MNESLNLVEILKDAPKGITFGNDILSYMLNDKAMNENLNLVEILKNVPKGTKLWSPICGDCYFKRIDEGSCSPIVCTAMLVNGSYCTIYFTEKGIYFNKFADGGCTLFPSRENHDWSAFKVPKKHKEFKPFEKVLVKELVGKNCEKAVWLATEYSHYDEDLKQHYCTQCYGFDDDEIMPYEGNEDMVGKRAEL